MATSDTKNDTTIPIISIIISVLVAVKPSIINERSLIPEAPIIIGIAIKNENSALTSRDTPHIIPPRVVVPEREAPGIRDKI